MEKFMNEELFTGKFYVWILPYSWIDSLLAILINLPLKDGYCDHNTAQVLHVP